MSEPLDEGEVELTDIDEQLWRNVHPAYLDDGNMTSQAFKPTSKDDQRLSSARAERVTARIHHMEFTEALGLESAGVWAVTVGEVLEVNLRAVWDERSQNPPDPCPTGHTYIDFRGQSGNKTTRLAQQLRNLAVARGRQHPEEA